MTPTPGSPVTADTKLEKGDYLIRKNGTVVQVRIEAIPSADFGETFLARPDPSLGEGGWVRSTGTMPSDITRMDLAIEVRRDGKTWRTNLNDMNWDLWCEWRPAQDARTSAPVEPVGERTVYKVICGNCDRATPVPDETVAMIALAAAQQGDRR